MRRAVISLGATALVVSLACGPAGCDLFLDEWGEPGQPCNDMSHCKYDQYCIGQRCTQNATPCESDSDCQDDPLLGPDPWCNEDNVCDHSPLYWDSIVCTDGEQAVCDESDMTCTPFPGESGHQWFCSWPCMDTDECPEPAICMLSEMGPSCGEPSWTDHYGVQCWSDEDCEHDGKCLDFEIFPGSDEYGKFCVEGCDADCSMDMLCCMPDGVSYDICVPQSVCPM